MRYHGITPSLLFLTLLCFSPASAISQSDEEKGLQIMQQAEQQDSGWHSSQAEITMILENKHGETRKRIMESKALEGSVTDAESDGDKRLIRFTYPPNVRDTGFLTYSHKYKDDDQWLYLPSLKRIRRIASRSKSGSFMGSEFAYEDIAGQELEKFAYRWLRDEDYEGSACFVIESTPVDGRNSGYLRRVSWIDQQHYYIHKTEYFDRDNKALKTLYFSGYQLYSERFWRATSMNMVNVQNDRSTQLLWRNQQLDIGLKDSDFTRRSLQR